jgi:hypothetical protein
MLMTGVSQTLLGFVTPGQCTISGMRVPPSQQEPLASGDEENFCYRLGRGIL